MVARSTKRRDIERFHDVHPHQRDTQEIVPPDTSDWPNTPYCAGQRVAISDPYVRFAGGFTDGAEEWYAGFDDALIGNFYGPPKPRKEPSCN